MRQTSIFDFFDIREDEIVENALDMSPRAVSTREWAKRNGIVHAVVHEGMIGTVESFQGCTARSLDAIVSGMKDICIYTKETISYLEFQRMMVNIGHPYRECHRGIEREIEVVKRFEGGHRLIRFAGREFPVYCNETHTFDGISIGEVVA